MAETFEMAEVFRTLGLFGMAGVSKILGLPKMAKVPGTLGLLGIARTFEMLRLPKTPGASRMAEAHKIVRRKKK